MRGTTNVPSVYVLLRREGKIVFVLRSNTGYMDGKYCLPAGHVEGLESFRQATMREAEEEVGIKLSSKQLRHAHTMHRHHGDHVRVDVFFEADGWTGDPVNNEPGVHSELAWFDESDLPFDKIVDWQAAALRCIARGEQYSELGWPRNPE
jgi:8-oxo-dGTP diphosphatase